MRKLVVIFTVLLAWTKLSEAQEFRGEIPEDPRRYIDTAVVLMDQQKYKEADRYYLIALDRIQVLSADFCFYFGKNSYFLNQYAQSIDWLNKYLELKGSGGQFSKEVLALLEKAEEGFRQNRTATAGVDVKTRFFYLNTVACDDSDNIKCPVCKGDDVITTVDRFGERYYKTCPYSHNGVLTCAEFNLLIQGKLKARDQ